MLTPVPRRVTHFGFLSLLLEVYTMVWHVYAALGRQAHPLKVIDGCEALLSVQNEVQNIGSTTVLKMQEWATRTRQALR